MTNIDEGLVVGAVAIAMVLIGASPVLLPGRLGLRLRWLIGLTLLMASLAYSYAMYDAAHPVHLLLLIPFWLGWLIAAVRLMSVSHHRRSE